MGRHDFPQKNGFVQSLEALNLKGPAEFNNADRLTMTDLLSARIFSLFRAFSSNMYASLKVINAESGQCPGHCSRSAPPNDRLL